MSVNVVLADGSTKRIAGGTLYADAPIGEIHAFGGAVIPNGYLLCNGQEVSRANYVELFAVIGVAFGSGDGSTTFNVPDLREATTKGVGLSGKSSNHYDSDGVALGEFINDRIRDHTHVAGIGQSTSSDWAFRADAAKSYDGSTSGVKDAFRGNTNEVKAVGVNYIIKAKQVGVPQDILDHVENLVKDLQTLSQITVAVPNGGVKLVKCGRIVQASFQIVGDNLADGFTSGVWTHYGNAGVIPEIYRPLNTVYCGGLMVVSSPILMRVATNGNLGYYYTGGNFGYEYEWSQSWISAT